MAVPYLVNDGKRWRQAQNYIHPKYLHSDLSYDLLALHGLKEAQLQLLQVEVEHEVELEIADIHLFS
jgi:hypothetical protein